MDIYKQMLERKSCRGFDLDRPLEDEKLKKILLAVQNAPTSVYGQQMSAIVIKDAKKLATFRDMIVSTTSYKAQTHIGECQAFVLFVSDFKKMQEVMEYENKELKVTENVEALLTGAVDVGIALGVATVVAESMGLGTVCIGALRGALKECIDFFKLPKYVLPICGICIGYPSQKGAGVKKKLRLPYESFVFEDYYQLKDFKKVIKEYNELTNKEVYDGRFTWSTNIAAYYAHEKYKENSSIIKAQGYEF